MSWSSPDAGLAADEVRLGRHFERKIAAMSMA
jgi:hypothetical protein